MFSNRRPRSLRTKVTATLVVLLALGWIIMSFVTFGATQHFLVRELDSSLEEASQRTAMAALRPPPGHHGLEGAPGQNPGMLSVHLNNGDIVDGGWIDDDENIEPLSGPQQQALSDLPANGSPHTIDIPGLGQYRAVAVAPETGQVVISGLPMEDVDATLSSLGIVVSVVALLGIAGIGGAGSLLVRRTMRPLREVSDAALAVTRLPLETGHTTRDVRLSGEVLDSSFEVATVGSAFNRMLDHVDAALLVRQRSEERLRQFVSDASHELRTPLASVRGYSELGGRHADLPEPVALSLAKIQAEAKRMTRLVEELLMLAQLDSDSTAAEFGPVDLARIVTEAVEDFTVTAPGDRWLLETPGRETVVHGDEDQLRRAVLNLLSNAHNHTPEGTTVRTRLAFDGGHVVLTVADDGPGVPDAERERIFGRFVRGDRSRSRATGTTGLGLAIVAAVVAVHRGRLRLESIPGDTEFIVRLPVRPD